MSIATRGTGTIQVRGANNLTAYDPIKNSVGYKDSRTHTANRSRTILGTGLESQVVTAGVAPSRSAQVLFQYGGVPSLPRRSYTASVLYTVGDVVPAS